MAQSARTAPFPAPRSPRKLTYEEFLDWPGENQSVEWVDGEVIEMSPVSERHEDIVGFLKSLLRFFAEERQLGVVLGDPFNMKTGPNLPGRAPDILFVAQEHLDRLKKKHLDGPADLAIEIISPDNPNRDRVEKYREYEQGGVREYWSIDPERQEALFYQRNADGFYAQAPRDADGLYHSAVLSGLWLDVRWLWQKPLPSLLSVLKLWRLV